MTAIMLPVLLGMAAVSIDYGVWLYQKGRMQIIADAASVGGTQAIIRGYTNSVVTYATEDAILNGYVAGGQNTLTVNYPPTSGANAGSAYAVQVKISQPSTSYLSKLLMTSSPTLTVNSVGTAQPQPTCLVTLGNSSGVTLTGSGSISAPNCGVYVNANVSNAISQQGSGSINSQKVTTAYGGTISSGTGSCGRNRHDDDDDDDDHDDHDDHDDDDDHDDNDDDDDNHGGDHDDDDDDDDDDDHRGRCGGGTSWSDRDNSYWGSKINGTKGVITNAAPCKDPHSSLSMPSPGSCTATNYSSNGTQTLNPGTYCGGMNLQSGANITLNPGTYIISGGTFNVANNATLTGQGVTIVLTGSANNYASLNIKSGASVNLSAPTSGSLSSVLFFGDRNASSVTHNCNGGSSNILNGVIYTPASGINIAGSSTTSGSRCTQIVCDRATVSGTCNLGGETNNSKQTQTRHACLSE